MNMEELLNVMWWDFRSCKMNGTSCFGLLGWLKFDGCGDSLNSCITGIPMRHLPGGSWRWQPLVDAGGWFCCVYHPTSWRVLIQWQNDNRGAEAMVQKCREHLAAQHIVGTPRAMVKLKARCFGFQQCFGIFERLLWRLLRCRRFSVVLGGWSLRSFWLN